MLGGREERKRRSPTAGTVGRRLLGEIDFDMLRIQETDSIDFRHLEGRCCRHANPVQQREKKHFDTDSFIIHILDDHLKSL